MPVSPWRLAAALLAARALVAAGLALQPRRRGGAPRHPQPASPAAPSLQRAKFRQVLQNQDGQGLEYTGSLSIGGQVLQGILDTGSYELLVFSSSCDTCGDISTFYNGSRSSTLLEAHLRTLHSFGSGDTWSQLAFEDVQIGPMKATRQYFWQVLGADLPVARDGGFQAIVGVGPPSTPREDSLAQAQKAEELKRLVKARGVTTPARARDAARDTLALAAERTLLESFGVLAFSVCLGRADGAEGYFIWDDDDPRGQVPGLFAAVPVIGNLTWGAHLAHVRMQRTGGDWTTPIGCEGGCGAIVDSGTSLIVVPTDAAKRALMGLSELNTDCSNLDVLPDLVFELGGVRLSLPPQAYIGQFIGKLPAHLRRFSRKHHRPVTYRACELLLMTMDVETQFGPLWILGNPFFREYYTTFDLGTSIWDRQNRSLFVANSDGACHPQPPTAGRSTLAQGMRRVDLSKVRLPGWVRRAAIVGSVRL